MNSIVLRYLSFVLVALLAGAGGGMLVANKRPANPPSGTTVAIPAQPFPGQGIHAIPAVPATPRLPKKGNGGVRLLSPVNGERFVQGKGPIHISWTGGTEKVWVILDNLNFGQWHWESNTYVPNAGTNWIDPSIPSAYDPASYVAWGEINLMDYVIAENQPASGSIDWDGMTACFGYQNTGCRRVLPGIYRILVVSQEKRNQPVTYETLFSVQYTNWDENKIPFLIITNNSISSLKVTRPTASDHWYSFNYNDGERVGLSVTGLTQRETYPGQVYTFNLYKGGKYIGTLSDDLWQIDLQRREDLGVGFYPAWVIPLIPNESLPAGNDYTVEVIFHGPEGDIKGSSVPFSLN